MRILEIVPHFPPFVGGVEHMSYMISKELVKRGHEVAVICMDRKPRTEVVEGINVKRLPIGFSVAGAPINFSVLNAIKKEEFDLIHTNIPTPWLAFCSVRGRKKRPVVVTYHNDIIGNTLFSSVVSWLYNRTMGKYVLSKADKIVVTTPIYPKISPWLRPHQDKIEVVQLGVDTDEYKPENSKGKRAAEIRKRYGKKIIFLATALGAYKQYKGVDVLLRAAKLMKEKEDFVVVITGEGPLKEVYRKMADDLGIGGCVDFVGRVPQKKLPFYYAACDVFALPSTNRMEGAGFVAVEAMASGRPVVASNISGIPYSVKDAGILVEPQNPQALADALLKVLGDEGLAKELGKKGRERVLERFTWDVVVDKREELYQNLLKA